MALKNEDLFVIQSQDDGALYKLKLQDLITQVEAGDSLNFRGSVDLNNPPATSDVTLPGTNGDMYVVESDAPAIDSGWSMQNGETEADLGDRIIYDGATNDWILVTSGTNTGGTVTGITATTPLQSDGDSINPVLTIDKATTTAGGYVARLATDADVEATTGTANSEAVVTADLLKATNDIVDGLVVGGGAVTTVTTTDANGNGALTINPTSGNVIIELENGSETQSGVVQIADAGKLGAGTAGGSAVVDAAALKAVADSIPDEGIQSIAEGGTGTVTNGLVIETTDSDVLIGVKEATFCPYNFAALTDITE